MSHRGLYGLIVGGCLVLVVFVAIVLKSISDWASSLDPVIEESH